MPEVFINFFTIVNLAILFILLWLRKDKTKANKFLALVVFTPSVPFFLNYLIYIKLINNHPWLQLLNTAYLWAPAVAFYVRTILGKTFTWKIALPHLIPTLINQTTWIYFISQGKAYTDSIFNNVFNGVFPWQFDALNALLLIQTLVYLIYAVCIINNKNPFSVQGFLVETGKITRYLFFPNGEKSNQKKWLRQFVGLAIFINVIVIFLSFIIEREKLAFVYTPLFYNVIYVLIVYKSFKYSGIFYSYEKSENARYSGSPLSLSQSKEYYTIIVSLVKKEKLYLIPELKLEDISDKLTISSHYISQAINQNEGKNFFEFINGFRIEEAKRLLKDPSKTGLTIETIAYDSGFGSKAAFNRAFKKYIGITPSEYAKDVFISNQ